MFSHDYQIEARDVQGYRVTGIRQYVGGEAYIGTIGFFHGSPHVSLILDENLKPIQAPAGWQAGIMDCLNFDSMFRVSQYCDYESLR